jgi:hypothetical protein
MGTQEEALIRLLRPETARDEGAMRKLLRSLKRTLGRPDQVIFWDNGEQYSDWTLSMVRVGPEAKDPEMRAQLERAFNLMQYHRGKGFVATQCDYFADEWTGTKPYRLGYFRLPYNFSWEGWTRPYDPGIDDHEAVGPVEFFEAWAPFEDILRRDWQSAELVYKVIENTHPGNRGVSHAVQLLWPEDSAPRPFRIRRGPMDAPHVEKFVEQSKEQWHTEMDKALSTFAKYHAGELEDWRTTGSQQES